MNGLLTSLFQLVILQVHRLFFFLKVIIIVILIAIPLDYSPISSILDFPAGSMDNAMACTNVTIIPDALVEGDETFEVNLSLETNDRGVALENDATIITIIDNEGEVLLIKPLIIGLLLITNSYFYIIIIRVSSKEGGVGEASKLPPQTAQLPPQDYW